MILSGNDRQVFRFRMAPLAFQRLVRCPIKGSEGLRELISSCIGRSLNQNAFQPMRQMLSGLALQHSKKQVCLFLRLLRDERNPLLQLP